MKGARRADLIERTPGSTVTLGFPIYDAHGNNVGTLSRNGSGGFNLGDRRSYDAWGQVRSQQNAGDPKLRYCASLGHKADDESGLIYMRARYYEPASGRFVSEDLAHDGQNWFRYCNGDPVNRSDQGGSTSSEDRFMAGAAFAASAAALLLLAGWSAAESKVLAGGVAAIATGYLLTAAFQFAMGFADSHISAGSKEDLKVLGDIMKTASALIGCIAAFAKSVKEAGPMMQAAGGIGVAMLGMCTSYFTQCVGALICIDEGW